MSIAAQCSNVRAEGAFDDKAKASSKYLGYTRHRARLSGESSRACACADVKARAYFAKQSLARFKYP